MSKMPHSRTILYAAAFIGVLAGLVLWIADGPVLASAAMYLLAGIAIVGLVG